MATTLLLPGLAFKIELTGLEPGPAVEQPFASEVRLEPVIVERPFTQIVAHEDVIVGVDGRYHVVADSLPGIFVSERGKKFGRAARRSAQLEPGKRRIRRGRALVSDRCGEVSLPTPAGRRMHHQDSISKCSAFPRA